MSIHIYAHAAQRIRVLRRSRGLPLEEVANRAEISASYLGQIERMERKPSLLTLAMIARALQVEHSHILDNKDAQTRNAETEERRLMAILTGIPAQHKKLALQTLQFFLRRLRKMGTPARSRDARARLRS